MDHLRKIQGLQAYQEKMYDSVSMPIEFGKDEVEHQYELFLQEAGERAPEEAPRIPSVARTAREQLEETIWSCLKHRR